MRQTFIKYALTAAMLAAAACGDPAENGAASGAGRTAQASAVDTTANASGGFRPGSIILFVGTSLTAGYGLEPEESYPNLIQQKLDSAGLDFDVVNAGISGETTSSLLRRIDWLLRQPFEIIVIETGANDGLRGVPVATMERNIQQIIEGVRAMRPRAQIVLAQMEAPPNLGASYTSEFRRVFPDLARRNDVMLLPFMLEGVAGVRSMNQGDGIHPNRAGARIVAENVWRGLRPVLQ
ncbi:MAG: arylesterase [Gemmatimonadaceae bacterium]